MNYSEAALGDVDPGDSDSHCIIRGPGGTQSWRWGPIIISPQITLSLIPLGGETFNPVFKNQTTYPKEIYPFYFCKAMAATASDGKYEMSTSRNIYIHNHRFKAEKLQPGLLPWQQSHQEDHDRYGASIEVTIIVDYYLKLPPRESWST